MKRRSQRACTPLFSEADVDLSMLKWRLDCDGYAVATVNSRVLGRKVIATVRSHRVIAARVKGLPLTADEVPDHINFDRTDNRRENIRVVTRLKNSQHRQATNPSGLRGVTWHKKSGKWQASVRHMDRCYYCGLHATPEAAAIAAAAKRELLGFPKGVV